MVLQDALVRFGGCRLFVYVAYHSAAQRQDKTSYNFMYVRTDLAQRQVDLSSFSSVSIEYAAVFVRLRESNATVVSVDVPPGSQCIWDVRELTRSLKLFSDSVIFSKVLTLTV